MALPGRRRPRFESIVPPELKEKRTIARSKEDLPSLPEGWVRCTHMTSKDLAEEILAGGLNYETQGMISSTARAASTPESAKYATTDRRYQGDHIVVVVIDMPAEEYRKHDAVGQSPGAVPKEFVVGIVPNENAPIQTPKNTKPSTKWDF